MMRTATTVLMFAWMCLGTALAQPVPPPEPPPGDEPVTAPVAPPPPAPVPPEEPEAVEEEGDEEPSVSVGEGRLKLGGLFQIWNTTIWGEETQGGPSAIDNTFRIRRAEIKLEATLIDDLVEAGVMIDPAKLLFGASSSEAREVLIDTDGDGVADDTTLVPRYRTNDSILQDLFIILLPTERLTLKVGQFKPPLGFEGPYSAAKIVFDERAMLSRELSGDNRDLGFVATLELERMGLQIDLGLFNGTPIGQASGLNEADENPWKDLVVRVGAEPVDGLELGISALYGVEGPIQEGPDPGSATDLRYGAWLRYSNDRIDARLEGMMQQFTIEGDAAAGIDDVDIPRAGFYALAEYRVIPKLGAGARFDYFNRNSDVDQDRSVDMNVTLGLNYYIHSHNAKLQLAHTFSIEGDLADDETLPESGQVADDQTTLVAQVAF